MKPFSKILVPIDFSEGSQLAIDRALDLAERYGASVTLYHAYQVPAPYLDGHIFSVDILDAIQSSAKAQLEKARVLAEQRAAEVPDTSAAPAVWSKLDAASPVVGILEEVKSGAYDLVVMGTHGRTGLSRVLIGSVAERVVRAAACAVMTVR